MLQPREIDSSPSISPQINYQNDGVEKEMLAKPASLHSGGHRRQTLFMVILVILVYAAADFMLPYYNKLLYAGLGSVDGFHYPIFSTWIQVASVATCLVIYSCVSSLIKTHFLKQENQPWIFSQFSVKVRELFWISMAFALLITLSNIGLDKINVNIHVLLRTTTVIWIVVLSTFFGEKPTVLQVLCAMLITGGAVLLGMDVSLGWSFEQKNVGGVIITLLSSCCSGVMTVLLRKTCIKTESGPLQMSVIELTAYKMGISAVAMGFPAIIMEVFMAEPNVLTTLAQNAAVMVPMLLGGIIITLLYQGAVVAVTSQAQAVSVGILHQILVFPQMVVYTLLNLAHWLPSKWKLAGLKPTVFHIVGGSLIVTGAFGYGLFRLIHGFIVRAYDKQQQQQQTQTHSQEAVSYSQLTTAEENKSKMLQWLRKLI